MGIEMSRVSVGYTIHTRLYYVCKYNSKLKVHTSEISAETLYPVEYLQFTQEMCIVHNSEKEERRPIIYTPVSSPYMQKQGVNIGEGYTRSSGSHLPIRFLFQSPTI